MALFRRLQCSVGTLTQSLCNVLSTRRFIPTVLVTAIVVSFAPPRLSKRKTRKHGQLRQKLLCLQEKYRAALCLYQVVVEVTATFPEALAAFESLDMDCEEDAETERLPTTSHAMDIVLQHYSLLNPQFMYVRLAMSRTRPSSLTNQHPHCAVFFLFVWRCGELAELHRP
jgi:hypothetical protein